MSGTVRVALVGISGYGGSYLRQFVEGLTPEYAKLVGVIDTDFERCTEKAYLNDHDIPRFSSLDAFFASHQADLVVISSPIQWHAPQSIQAVRNGANVLCEKPVSATIQEATNMQAAATEAGKFIAIGYQWSFSTTIRQLKQDIQAGLLGAPQRLRTMVCWPRRESYYKRNSWAGSLKTADGRWILDSPVNNATAHYLHNMLYILGKELATSATLRSVTGELYRANPITNYDTATLRCLTDDGVEVLFLSSHAVRETVGPVASYEFENATVTIGKADSLETNVVATFKDGSKKEYGDPNSEHSNKLLQAIAAVRGECEIPCGVAAASAQTLCMNGLQESTEQIVDVPRGVVAVDGEAGDLLTYISGMNQHLQECFDRGCLLSDLKHLDWTVPGKQVDLTDYNFFPRHEQLIGQA